MTESVVLFRFLPAPSLGETEAPPTNRWLALETRLVIGLVLIASLLSDTCARHLPKARVLRLSVAVSTRPFRWSTGIFEVNRDVPFTLVRK